MPVTDQLEITGPNGETILYPLDPAKTAIRIGRHKDNDLILDSPEIGLLQAVLDRRTRPYHILVIDRRRKMTLAGRELLPNVQYPLRDGEKLQVSGYSIVLRQGQEPVPVEGSKVQTPSVPAGPAVPAPPQAATGVAAAPSRASANGIRRAGPSSERPSDRLDDLIIVELPAREWTVDVDQVAMCKLSVVNGGRLVAMFEISVKDLDASWVTITPAQVSLNEGGRAEVTLEFRAPGCPPAGPARTRFSWWSRRPLTRGAVAGRWPP